MLSEMFAGLYLVVTNLKPNPLALLIFNSLVFNCPWKYFCRLFLNPRVNGLLSTEVNLFVTGTWKFCYAVTPVL